VADEIDADKLADAPAEAGQAEEAPQNPDAEEVVQEALDAETKAEAPEGTGDEEQVETQADDTSMAPSSDVVLEAIKKDPRFANSTFTDSDSFFESVANLRAAYSQRNEDAVLGRQVAPHFAEFEKWREQQDKEAKGQRSWNPPPMPIGIEDELLKPEGERNAAKIEAFNARRQYINDRQRTWIEDPDKQLAEHTLPAVERLVNEMFAARERKADLTTYADQHQDYIEKPENYAGIKSLMEEGVPFKQAVELHQLRSGTKATKATKAKEVEVAELASASKGPRPSPRSKEEVAAEQLNDLDPGAIVRAELAKGPLAEDPQGMGH
jgi:hypothetical protein